MLQIIVIVITLVVLYRWLNQKPANFPPGPPTIPLIGSLLGEPRENFHYSLERMREKYGPIIGLKFGPYPAVAVCSPELVIEVFRRDDFSNRPSLAVNNRPKPRRLGGVMFANGDGWKHQRRFTLRHLRDFGFGKRSMFEMINNEVEEFCAKKMQGKTKIEISGLFNTSAINILWAMVAGERLSYDDSRFQKLLENLERLFRQGQVTGGIINTVPGLRAFISLFHEMDDDKTDRMMIEYFCETIEEHKRTRTEEPRDLIDVYLAEFENPARHESFTMEVMQEVLRDFFAAGTESSSNTVSFSLMYLLLHPEWQDKLHEEVDRVLAGRAPLYEDRNQLPLVEAYLSEVQRNNTIAPFSVPHATTKATTLAGYSLPADTFVLPSIWAMLQDKKHWGDPENFRPERFLDQQGKFVKDPYMLVFGAGPRLCVGEALAKNFAFMFFVSMIQRYKFTQPAEEALPSTVCKPGFTTAPQKFFANVTPRS